MRMNDYQIEKITGILSTIKEKSRFYKDKFGDMDLSKVRTQEDFEKLPFTGKEDLRDAYPLGL
ncbi:MAG: phenylacetate--CoA ligase family protein, partial [Candidatus Methanoplasma sp.]|nr:phenylacetate--CoA ligase family protein [Candidatus Methanoplasma sp.]